MPGAPTGGPQNDILVRKVQVLENKLDALMNHLGINNKPDHSHGRQPAPISKEGENEI